MDVSKSSSGDRVSDSDSDVFGCPTVWRCLSSPYQSLVGAIGDGDTSLVRAELKRLVGCAKAEFGRPPCMSRSTYEKRRAHEAAIGRSEKYAGCSCAAIFCTHELAYRLCLLKAAPDEDSRLIWPGAQTAQEWYRAPMSGDPLLALRKPGRVQEGWRPVVTLGTSCHLVASDDAWVKAGLSATLNSVLRSAEQLTFIQNLKPTDPIEGWRHRRSLMTAEDDLMERLLSPVGSQSIVDLSDVTCEGASDRGPIVYRASDGGAVVHYPKSGAEVAQIGSGYSISPLRVRRFDVYERIANLEAESDVVILYVPPDDMGHFEGLLSASSHQDLIKSNDIVDVSHGPAKDGQPLMPLGRPITEWTWGMSGRPVRLHLQSRPHVEDHNGFTGDSVGARSVSFKVNDMLRLDGQWSSDGDRLSASLCFKQDDATIPIIRILNAWQAGKETYAVSPGRRAHVPKRWLEQFGSALDDLLRLQSLHGESIPLNATGPLIGLAGMLGTSGLVLHDAADEGDEGLAVGSAITLRDYQQDGVQWLRQRFIQKLGGILADDMGLGKTCQALVFIDWIKRSIQDSGPTLVVTPTSVIGNWVEEANRFVPGLRVSQYYGARRAIDQEADVIITTYGVVRSDLAKLNRRPWAAVFLDEAQAIKNPTSKTARACRRLKATSRFALTGTPFENSLSEFWSIADFVAPGAFGTRPRFIRHFRSIEQSPGSDSSHKKIDHLTRCIDPFLLRRLKEGVATELPPKEVRYELCGMTPDQAQMYSALESNFRRKIGYRMAKDGFQKTRFAMFEAMMRLRQAACDPNIIPNYEGYSTGKRQRLRALLEASSPKAHRWLIFSQWTSLLANVRGDLDTLGLSYLYLDGSTRNRLELQTAWNQPDGADVFLISLKAGGTGLNLTAADRVVLLDPWWNPAVEDQAMDRAYRIGQEKPVLVLKMIARGTIEERVVRTQERKRGLFDALINYGVPTAREKATVKALFGGQEIPSPSVDASSPSGPLANSESVLPKSIGELLVFHGSLTNQLVREALGCSSYTATRRLKQWAKEGLLVRRGRRKNTRYLPADEG